MSRRKQPIKLGTNEGEATLADAWYRLMATPNLREAERLQEVRLRRMAERGAPVRVQESLENLRRRMWRDGIPKTITVKGAERYPVDEMAARVTGMPKRSNSGAA